MKLRRRLWEADPHCHWCGQATVWFDEPLGSPPKNAATLDHLYSQLDPRRREPGGGTHVVLACWRCNHDRGEAEDSERGPNPPRQPGAPLIRAVSHGIPALARHHRPQAAAVHRPMSSSQARAPLAVICPYCKAPAGAPCSTTKLAVALGGKPRRRPHGQRRMRAAWMLAQQRLLP